MVAVWFGVCEYGTVGPVIDTPQGIVTVEVIGPYVPAAKTITAQLGALDIVLLSVLGLMPLLTLMVGPPHPARSRLVGGPGVGVGVGLLAEPTTRVLWAGRHA